jgi:hypothetical protein
LSALSRLFPSYHDSNTFIVAFYHGRTKMRTTRLLLALAVLSLAALPFLAKPAAADTNTGTAGQPNQSCQAVFPSGPLTPPGFNTDGFTNAANVYAGSGQNTQNPGNVSPNAVSQYDVACFQAGQH